MELNRVDCRLDGCQCRRQLFTRSPDFTGTVEVKCPRCRRIHRFGPAGMLIREVRCPNSFKGENRGGWCGQLVMKISQDSVGTLGYRCPRCKDERTVRIDMPAMAST